MLKLTRTEEVEDVRDVLPFPTEAVRKLGWGVQPGRVPTDRGACDAARRVEAAMAAVERKFARLKLIVEQGDDNDRPRAA
jgi:hypothetical protein